MATAQKKCGKCDKTVYPTEEIKCLDKVWHKGCLKCTVCGTTLNIKSVKGYDKMPYCNVHYPQPKSTVVADNPEMQRIRQLTDIQSNAKYHKDFNENKGKLTVIADDPATVRAKEQQRNVSQVEYTSKRKDSASQILTQDTPQQSKDNNDNNRSSNVSESAVGRVADYDPMNNDRGSLARGYEPTSKGLHGAKFEAKQTNTKADNNDDHNNKNNGSSGNEKRNSSQQVEVQVEPPTNDVHHDDQAKRNSHGDSQSTKMKVRALYSYTAAAEDEIDFHADDILVECEEIDPGWMSGRNSRTNQEGLLPSNYVEIID